MSGESTAAIGPQDPCDAAINDHRPMVTGIKQTRSKPVATWLALLGGSLGLHRFYLHGMRDRWGWLYSAPTLAGCYGVFRMRALGADDRLAWVLIPLLGLALASSMLGALIYGLTPDERWNLQRNAGTRADAPSGWGTIIAVVLALALGAGVTVATLAFVAQRYFEYRQFVEPA